ncbi:SGNH hydrolase domain-containing protein [Caballeronia hypogeia]
MPAVRALVCFMGVPLLCAGAIAGCARMTDGFLFAYPAKIQNDVRWSGTALFDMPRAKRCWSKVEVADERSCVLGDASAGDKAILWGDSHAYHLIYFFDQLGRSEKLAIHDVGFTLCPPIAKMPPLPGEPSYKEDHLRCVAHDRAVMAHVMSRPDIRTVFLAAAWQNYQNLASAGQNGHGFQPGELEAELTATISQLRAAGKRVILVDDVPMIPMELVNCDFNNDLFFPVRRRNCEFDASIARTQHAPIGAMLERLANTHGARIMHTFDVPCTDAICRLDFDGLPIYRFDDYHHLSVAGSTLLYDRYMARHPGEVPALLGRKLVDEARGDIRPDQIH